VTIDVEGAAFHAELLVPGPQVGGRQLTGLDGSWIGDRRAAREHGAGTRALGGR
jgi:hypothetical protein